MTSRPQFDQRLILWLSLAQLITWGSVFYTFALLVEPVERELGLGRAQTSLAFSLALLVEGFCALRIGRWIDRGHERLVMTGGSLLVGGCLLLHGFIGNLWGFYAVWALLGAGMSATLYAPVFAVVTRRFPDNFRRGIITMTFLGGLASTVFIPLSAWLIAAVGLAAMHCGAWPVCSSWSVRRCMACCCATRQPAMPPGTAHRMPTPISAAMCAAPLSC
jgi:MFS family permease